MSPFLLFHWSPVSRRKQILKEGLCPGKKSRCGKWKPPYICLSKSPSHAWGASAAFSKEEGEWDLWMVWSNELKGWELLPAYGNCVMREYRVYHRIKKINIWHVGTRIYKKRKNQEK